MTSMISYGDDIYEVAKNAFREFLDWSRRQIKKLLNWITDHPQDSGMILVAIVQASMGDLSGLKEIGIMVLRA